QAVLRQDEPAVVGVGLVGLAVGGEVEDAEALQLFLLAEAVEGLFAGVGALKGSGVLDQRGEALDLVGGGRQGGVAGAAEDDGGAAVAPAGDGLRGGQRVDADAEPAGGDVARAGLGAVAPVAEAAGSGRKGL